MSNENISIDSLELLIPVFCSFNEKPNLAHIKYSIENEFENPLFSFYDQAKELSEERLFLFTLYYFVKIYPKEFKTVMDCLENGTKNTFNNLTRRKIEEMQNSPSYDFFSENVMEKNEKILVDKVEEAGLLPLINRKIIIELLGKKGVPHIKKDEMLILLDKMAFEKAVELLNAQKY